MQINENNITSLPSFSPSRVGAGARNIDLTVVGTLSRRVECNARVFITLGSSTILFPQFQQLVAFSTNHRELWWETAKRVVA